MVPSSPLPGGTVVVGIDGSEAARHAAAFGAGLADALGAKLDIVYVAHGVPLGAGEGSMDAGRKAKGEDILREEVDQLRFLGIRPEQHLLWGEPAETLATYVNENPDAGLLVVGRRGAGPLVRALAGSVASRMAHLTHKPLLVIP